MKIVLLKDTVINGSIWPLGSIMEMAETDAALLVENKSAMVQNEETEPEEKTAAKQKADK